MSDHDATMLREAGYTLGELQYKYKVSGPMARTEMRPQLEAAYAKYENYRIILLGPADVVTEADLEEMRSIRSEVEAAASKQQLLTAIGRIIGFFLPRLV